MLNSTCMHGGIRYADLDLYAWWYICSSRLLLHALMKFGCSFSTKLLTGRLGAGKIALQSKERITGLELPTTGLSESFVNHFTIAATNRKLPLKLKSSLKYGH